MNIRVHQRLVSKILHDIIAPASSVLNGIELLGGMKSLDAEILQFMHEGAVTLNEKLKMFRLAFGATGDPGITNLREFAQKTASFVKVFDGQYAPISQDQMSLDVDDVRVVSGIIVMVCQIATGAFTIALSSEATNLRSVVSDLRFCFKPSLVEYLSGTIAIDIADIDVHHAQAWLVRVLADSCEMCIEVVANEPGNITLHLNKA